MAFQQQHRAPAQRHVVYDEPATPPPRIDTSARYPEESQEWVLFSPEPQTAQSTSAHTPQTVPLSNFSYFGSIETAAPTEDIEEAPLDVEEQQEEDRDNEDLDSLDDGLHAFNDPGESADVPGIEQSATVLPTHDGLGTFPGNSSNIQASLWQHETYNPRRRRHSLRRTSLQKQYDALDQAIAQPPSDDEKTRRIEQWRLDQSKAILEEIERETRRLRRKKAVVSRHARSSSRSIDQSISSAYSSTATDSTATEQKESWWQRFTRQIIQNLIGIDDATLSFIFGDTIQTDAKNASSEAEMIAHAEKVVTKEMESAANRDGWEENFLARMAQELGSLIHQISEHPGAFDAFLRTQEPPPYAGIANTVETAADRQQRRISSKGKEKVNEHQVPSTPYFAPTLNNPRPRHRRRPSAIAANSSLWGIEEEDDMDLAAAQRRDAAEEAAQKEYWEKDLDVKMVFGFLKNRLSSDNRSHQPESSDAARSNASDSLRRAALIRHHHPLVASSSAGAAAATASLTATSTIVGPSRPRLEHIRSPSSALSTPLSPVLGRRSTMFMDGAESCASQSTKRSKTRHSGSLSLGSSRNYWDIGASSVGSGHALSAGGWGEV